MGLACQDGCYYYRYILYLALIFYIMLYRLIILRPYFWWSTSYFSVTMVKLVRKLLICYHQRSRQNEQSNTLVFLYSLLVHFPWLEDQVHIQLFVQCMLYNVGLSAIVLHLPIDQFCWSGWYICLHSSVIASLVLLWVQEKWIDLNRVIKTNCKKRHWSCQLTTTSAETKILSYVCIETIVSYSFLKVILLLYNVIDHTIYCYCLLFQHIVSSCY